VVSWRTNALGLPPSLVSPAQLMQGPGLHPLIASDRGLLLGEISDRNRRVWVLSDPDVIANHGLARAGNAALAVAIINGLRASSSSSPASRKGESSGEKGGGKVVFDETVHGYLAKPLSPFFLLFSFPFVVATGQALIALALLLWATMARFGAPQSAPAPLSAGRSGLLQNVAKLIEFTGHQPVIVARYVRETMREVARALHAPRGVSGAALIAWLQRVGGARGVDVDCGALIEQADRLAPAGPPAAAAAFGQAEQGIRTGRRDASALVRLARDTHRWKGEILDGRARDPRRR
jgi:hypothetical protein